MNLTKRAPFAHARAALVAAAALMLAAPGARAETDATVVSLPAEGVQFLPFYVAQDAGLFVAQGLAVKLVYLAGVGTTNGVISGAVDFGFSNGASLTRAAARGQHLIAIALMADRPTWSILLRRDEAEAIHFDAAAPLAVRARAMAGRRFGVDSVQSVAHALARVVAKIGGTDPERLEISPLVAPEAMAALQRKAIDGLVIASPWQEQLEASGAAIVIADSLKGDPPWLTPFAGGLVITRVQFCAEHRRVCVKMGHALAAAVAFVHDHPQAARASLATRFTTVAPDVRARAFDTVQQATPATPVPTEAAVANSDRLNLEAGFITADEQIKSYGALVIDEFAK
jgi:ABC-type nitrate/sulfonate/bicarbonate transport system substrate-binding protein